MDEPPLQRYFNLMDKLIFGELKACWQPEGNGKSRGGGILFQFSEDLEAVSVLNQVSCEECNKAGNVAP